MTDNTLLNLAQGINKNLAALVEAFQSVFPISVSSGTFTCTASSTTTVTDANVETTSIIVLAPVNSAAATLQGAATNIYPTASSGTFTVKTANGGSPSGSEIFQYIVVNLS